MVAERIRQETDVRGQQGYAVDNLENRWEEARGNRTALMEIHQQLKSLPLANDWPYDEPDARLSLYEAR